MSDVNRKYPVTEIAINLQNHADDSGGERSRVGDIIARRKEHFVIGSKEAKGRLWLRVEGLEEDEMRRLTEGLVEPASVDPASVEGAGPYYDKRRYAIPLKRIKELYPAFDIERALDLDDIYQPFLNVDEDNFRYLSSEKPLSVYGLVYDKAIGDYL